MSDIFRYEEAAVGFKKVPGSLSTIAVGDPQNVWGINSKGDIYRFDVSKGKFSPMAAGQKLEHIAVGSGVWGIDTTNKPYKWDGTKFSPVGGTVHYIGVPTVGGEPWARYGSQILRFKASSNSFEPVKGEFTFLGVGPGSDNVWVLDAAGWPWRWSSTKFAKRNDESLRFKYIAPGQSSTYAISLSGHIYHTANLTGGVVSSFETGLITGILTYLDTGMLNVSVPGFPGADVDYVWGLNSSGKAYQLESGGWKLHGGPFTKLAVGIGESTEGLAADGKTTVTFDKRNVWALG